MFFSVLGIYWIDFTFCQATFMLVVAFLLLAAVGNLFSEIISELVSPTVVGHLAILTCFFFDILFDSLG